MEPPKIVFVCGVWFSLPGHGPIRHCERFVGKVLSGNVDQSRCVEDMWHEFTQRSLAVHAHVLHFQRGNGEWINLWHHKGSTLGVQGQLSVRLEEFLDGLVPGSCRHVRRHAGSQTHSLDGVFVVFLHGCAVVNAGRYRCIRNKLITKILFLDIHLLMS